MRLTSVPVQVVLLMAVAWAAAADSVQAGNFGNWMREIECGYQKNNAWPWPAFCSDREAVRAPFETMVANGWRRQNLLGPHHFDPNTGRLTEAGKLKIQWVMTQAPPQFRQVYIERSLKEEITKQRQAAADEFAARVVRGEVASPATPTHLISEGRPASTVDAINVKFMENMPTPILPSPGSGSSFGGGGG